ncbi:MAG: electron transfer flavoprotein subunit beta/FixA family protein [Chloroflexota bacterium]
MDILVCVKRVPATGAKIVLTEDGQAIDTRNLGFAVSPHEECAVEEAVRLTEKHGGDATVLTLGEEASIEQLREALSMGINDAILLETDGRDWQPISTANAIIDAIKVQQAAGKNFDLLLFGNESADSGGYQIGIRVAYAFDLPIVTGVKSIEIEGDKAVAKREAGSGWEVFEVDLPAVITVKEGINLPRYPSLPGRMRAKKKPIERIEPNQSEGGLEKIQLHVPQEEVTSAQILGDGPAAAPKVVQILKELGLV